MFALFEARLYADARSPLCRGLIFFAVQQGRAVFREFWNHVPKSEPYRICLAYVRDRMSATRDYYEAQLNDRPVDPVSCPARNSPPFRTRILRCLMPHVGGILVVGY